MSPVSINSPVVLEWPANEWPAPRIAVWSPYRRAKSITCATSAGAAQRAIACGGAVWYRFVAGLRSASKRSSAGNSNRPVIPRLSCGLRRRGAPHSSTLPESRTEHQATNWLLPSQILPKWLPFVRGLPGPRTIGRPRRYPVGNLVGGELLPAGAQRPVMPEGVTNDAVSLAPEHLRDRHLHRGSHLDGVREGTVDVVELEQQQDR